MASLTDAIYFRRVSILRPKTSSDSATAVGGAGYSGVEGTTDPSDPEGMVVLMSGVPCSIQASNTGRKKDAALPEDAVWAPQWNVFIWGFAVVPQGFIRDRDILLDDQGYRYQVAQAYFNILGWKLPTIRLEA